MSDLVDLSIGALKQQLAGKQISPVDILEACLSRIDRLEPSLHAFITLDRDGARAAAKDVKIGPLAGIPIAIKDVIDVEGMATTCHSKLRLTHLARQDAAAVAKLRAAGAIIIGKLATHEFAIGGPCFDLPFPPARNPWNINQHPGGSSSGAGSAVAARMVPGALGTDTAGSVRNPASACGIVGLKPTYDLISREGVFPLAFSLDHVGTLTRTVQDAAILLDVLQNTPRPPLADHLSSDIRGLRIGVIRHFYTKDMPADAQTATAIEATASQLADAGAIISDINLPSLLDFAAVNRTLLQAEGFAIHQQWLRESPGAYAGLTRRILLGGAFLSAEDYVQAQRHRRKMINAVELAFESVDVMMTASSMEPACKIEDPAEIQRSYMRQARTPFNVTGHPALAMMSSLSATGLPLSVQFIGRYFDEATLLNTAFAFERQRGVMNCPIG
jgi:aspartyl-tRNA(Asn)/glutamyl-tRNA(Gln) amidotransferase subunit A